MKKTLKQAGKPEAPKPPVTEATADEIQQTVNKGSGFTASPFAEIGKAIGKLKLSVPTFVPPGDLSNLATSVAGKIEAARRVQDGVAQGLKFVLEAHRQLVRCTGHLERRFAKEELDETLGKVNEYLTQVLGLKGSLRTVAAAAYLKTVLGLDFATAEEVRIMLNDLVSRGLLVTSGVGSPITIGYLHYKIGPDFGLDQEDIAEVGRIVNQLSLTVKKLEHDRRQAMDKEMVAQANVTLDEVLANKDGTCLIKVPAEAFEKDGQTQWRGGGNITFQFGKEITAIRASGSVERLIADIGRRGASLPRHALTWDKAPGFYAAKQAALKNHGLSDSEGEQRAKDMITMWHMLRRGIARHNEIKARQAQKQEMAARATITAEEFFGLNGSTGQPKDGVALLAFDGAVKTREGRLISPFMLVSREGESFELVELPPHLDDAFGKFMGKKFPVGDLRQAREFGDLISKIRGEMEMAAATADASHAEEETAEEAVQQ